MKLIEAMNTVKNGSAVISYTGITYTYEQLKPDWCGEHYASFQTCGMTETERKGDWREAK